jgi:hypothetical protein
MLLQQLEHHLLLEYIAAEVGAKVIVGSEHLSWITLLQKLPWVLLLQLLFLMSKSDVSPQLL